MAKHTDVYELCSLDEYDNEQAKVRSSLSWLIAKAHPRGAPEKLQSLFITDHDGVWYVRPAVIDSLVSCELYSAACNTLFGTSDRRFRDFDAVLNYLRDCGIPVQYGEEELLAEVLRANARGPHEAAFDVYAHVTLCDCLMQAYANDLVKLDFILDTICKYAPSGVDQSPPVATSFDEALVLWINNVCSQCDIELEKRAQLDSAFRYEVPQLTNVNDDLADGRALSLALFFYAPVGFIRIDDLALQRAPSLADSVHNLVSFLQSYENILRELTTASKRSESQSGSGSSSGSTPEGSKPNAFADVISHLTTAQTELLRTFRCYLTIEDLLYSVRSVELNSIVFLLELFYVAECVLNGTTPPSDAAPAAAMTGSAFVPALETVVEVDLEQTEPDIDPNDSAHTHVSSEQQASTLSRDNGLDTSTETDSNAKENQQGDFVLEDDDPAQCGQFALDTTNRPLYRTYTKEHAKRSEAALADKRAESGHQVPSTDGHSAQQTQQPDNTASSTVAQPVESSSKGSSVTQPDNPSRITFGMLKRSPTPLLNPHSTATPAATPRMAPNTATDSVISPPPLLSPPVSSLKEQFLKSKLAKREQPLADASLKSSAHRDGASSQTVTWANLKRRSQPDLDAATGSLGRPIDPKPTLPTSMSAWSDRMSRSAIGTTSISQTTMHVTTSASGSDLSLVTARRASPVRMASGGDSPSLSPCGPDLTALHIRFEQKKRAIETERARMLDDLTRQRHAVSNQAFVHVLNLRRARGSDLPPSGANVTQQSSQQAASSTASAPLSTPSVSQRTHTPSMVNASNTHLADEQLRFLEKVDGDLTHYQAEIERLQRRSTTLTSPGVTNSLDSNTSAPTPTPGIQQRERTTWQVPHRVDPEIPSQPDSYRSTATGERSTSMFFLNDTVNTHTPTSTVSVSRGAQPQFNDTIDTTSSNITSNQVVVQKTLGNQTVVASSTLLQQNSSSVQEPDTAALPHRPPRSHGAETTNAVASAVVEPLQLPNGDAQHASKPSARKVDDQRSSSSRSMIDDPDMPKSSWTGTNGARQELLSASSTARTDIHSFTPAKPSTNGESLLRTETAASDDADLQNRMQLDEMTDPLEVSGYSTDGLRPASNAVGFVIGEESTSATELEDRRRRRLLETAARRAEEAAMRQREREAEAAARELARAQRADENERRKQAERARREAIFRDYVERKQSEATGPPYAVSNYAAHTAPSATRPARAVNSTAKQQQQPAVDGPIKRASSMRRKATRDERAKSAFIVVNGDDDVDSEPVASNMANSVERASTSASSSHTFEPLSAAQTSRTGRNTNANASTNASASAFTRASSATRSFRAGASQRAGAFSLHPDPDLTQTGVNQHVLANADVNVNVNANTTSDGDPQTKLFVKPKSKSNRSVIMNAVAYACLAGSVNETQKRTVLDEIERSNASHFVILFRDSGSSQFKAVYEFDEERDCLTRLVGVGPRQLTSPMVEKFFKFNSGTKSFSEVTSTRHLSTVIDAITLFERYWQVLKKAAQPSNNSNSSVASPATADTAKAHSASSSRSVASAGAADRTIVPAMAHQSSANRAVAATGARRGLSPAPPAVLAGSRPIRKQ